MLWVLAVIIFTIILLITLKPFRYWSSKGAKQSSLLQQWVDNIKIVLQLVSPAEHTLNLHKRFASERYFGTCYYFTPTLFIHDPELIKQITVKNFDHFTDRYMFVNPECDTLWAKTLFLLRGDEWKSMRHTLSPSFTGSKLKGMFGLVKQSADDLVQFYKNHPSAAKSVELKDAFTRYSNDVIASAAFGVTCNSLEHPNNEFYLMGKRATNIGGFWANLSFLTVYVSPWLAQILGVRLLPKDADTFFRNLIKDTIEIRERKGIVRPDMIHLLMEARSGKLTHDDMDTTDEEILKQEKLEKPKMTDEDITAQALVFFFAGFDSTATLMSFLGYEMALNPDIQSRLRDEIDSTLEECNGSITYDALLKMKYLDMVISETLRKWPSINIADRICIKPYTIQPTKPDDKPLVINKGDALWIPIYAMHHDSVFHPEPDRYDPERFSDANKLNIVPCSYFPFGNGPRACIGNRFALLSTKILFFTLLSKFEIYVVEKTEIPLTLSKKYIDLVASKGLWVGLRLRTQS